MESVAAVAPTPDEEAELDEMLTKEQAAHARVDAGAIPVQDLPDKLSAEDMALLRPMLEEIDRCGEAVAQTKAAVAKAIEIQIEARGAAKYVLRQMAPKYRLTENDEIKPDGTIARVRR